MPALKTTTEDLARTVRAVVRRTPVLDVHTHVYPPAFGKLMLWGIEELLTYHYLVAEVFRRIPPDYDAFYAKSKREQADVIWRQLFLENSPVSEACRGPLTCMKMLGLDVSVRTLDEARDYFANVTASEYVNVVFEKANVRKVVMTNDPFDAAEHAVWMKDPSVDPRFATVLRIDPVLCDWPRAATQLRTWGYRVKTKIDAPTVKETSRFLLDWVGRIRPLYLAASLQYDFTYPDRSPGSRMLRDAVLPVARKAGIPFAAMIGVNRQVNPGLRVAGDGVGTCDVGGVERLCRDFPDNRFLVTMLARENQHQLCVAARKFGNLMPFGCWWFLNDPSLVEEMTRMRTELLGLSYVPQHSDARVFDQLMYKWTHSRAVIAKVLIDKYRDLAATGWQVKPDEIERDVANLFGGNFERFLADTPKG
ncbi:MAG TPA: glucuronate isomerase [Planctomycetota bacterium]|nr:glucuronate isomerase [Planctomycetota bacterium]